MRVTIDLPDSDRYVAFSEGGCGQPNRLIIQFKDMADMQKASESLTKTDSDVLQDDLRDMLRALGLPDGARPQSPHEVFRECIAEVKRIKNDALQTYVDRRVTLDQWG